MWTPVTITIATDTQKSAAFKLHDRCIGLGVYVPTITSATLTFEVYVGRSPTAADTDPRLAADVDTHWEPLSAAFYTPAATGDIVLNLAQQNFGGCWMRIISNNVQAVDRVFQVNQHGSVSQ